MEIYLLRHGIAEESRPGKQDAERALTAEGKRRLREVLKVARNAGVQPSQILTSPLRRAAETARLAATVLHHSGEVLTTRALLPGARPEDVWSEIRIHKDAQQILLAGHEPLFSRLAAYLLASPTLQIDVKKGSLIRIDLDQLSLSPRGSLKWMLVPRLAAATR